MAVAAAVAGQVGHLFSVGAIWERQDATNAPLAGGVYLLGVEIRNYDQESRGLERRKMNATESGLSKELWLTLGAVQNKTDARRDIGRVLPCRAVAPKLDGRSREVGAV